MENLDQVWRNRVTGDTCCTPPNEQPLGLWCMIGGATWCGTDDHGSGVPDTLLPNEYIGKSLLRISNCVDELEVRMWSDWLTLSPVDSDLMNSPVEKPDEAALRNSIASLEEICRKPRAHLMVVEMREPVSRARRVPPRAIGLLSAHSEDWHSRTFRSVRPKVILAEVIDDELAIYENRALRTLRNRILEKLTPRLIALIKLLSDLERKTQGEAVGYRFRIRRLCLLLNELISNSQQEDQLKALVEKLESVHKRLLGLGSTILLKTIRNSPPIASPLLATNILRDDRHYRKVYDLWHKWESYKDESLSRAERLRLINDAMNRYVAILCARALGLLSLVYEDEGCHMTDCVFEPGCKPVELKRRWSFAWNEDGTFTLHSPLGDTALRIVAIAAHVDRLPIELVGEFAAISEDANANASPVLLLALGDVEESPGSWSNNFVAWRERQLHSLVNIPRLLLLDVSPSSLDTVEHVARVIRRVITEVEWPELPLKIKLPQGFASASRDLSHAVSESFAQPPSANLVTEISRLERLTGDVITKLENGLNEIIDQIERSRFASQTSELAKERTRIENELKASKDKCAIWTNLLRELERVESIFAPVLVCPCCGWITTNAPQASMFSCSSDSCNTRWGKRPDATGIMHVFLMPNGEDPSNPPHGQDPLDRYGADFL